MDAPFRKVICAAVDGLVVPTVTLLTLTVRRWYVLPFFVPCVCVHTDATLHSGPNLQKMLYFSVLYKYSQKTPQIAVLKGENKPFSIKNGL